MYSGASALGSTEGLQLKPLASGRREAGSRCKASPHCLQLGAGAGEGQEGGWPQHYFPMGGRLLAEFCHQSLGLHLKSGMKIWACLERVNRKEAGFRKPCHIRNERRNWELEEEKLLGGSDNCPTERLSVL